MQRELGTPHGMKLGILGVGYLDRYKHDHRNTPVDDDVELSMAMMVSMHDWRGKFESYTLNLTLSKLMSITRFCGASRGVFLFVSLNTQFRKAIHLIYCIGKELLSLLHR